MSVKKVLKQFVMPCLVLSLISSVASPSYANGITDPKSVDNSSVGSSHTEVKGIVVDFSVDGSDKGSYWTLDANVTTDAMNAPPEPRVLAVGSNLLSNSEFLSAKFKITAPSGKIIEDMFWVDGNKRLRDVDGDWKGKSSFEGSEEVQLEGYAVEVVTDLNPTNAKSYFWDRWPLTSSNKGNGKIWYAGDSDHPLEYIDNVSESTVTPGEYCPQPEQENAAELAQRRAAGKSASPGNVGLPKYPGCTDTLLNLYTARSKSFSAESSLNLDWVPVEYIDQSTISAKDSVVDDNESKLWEDFKTKRTGHISNNNNTEFGKAEPDGPDNFLITYTQTFNDDVNHMYWANPGAKMNWYFARFDVSLKAKTYNYGKREVRVVFSDEGSGCQSNCSPPPPPPPVNGCAASPLVDTTIGGASVKDKSREILYVEDLTSNPVASIRSVTRGNELFNVDQSIPSGHYLYENITDARRYLTEYCYEKVEGTATYTATVTNRGTAYENFRIITIPKKGSFPSYSTRSDSKQHTRTRTQDYTYYKLKGYAVYRLDSANFQNPKRDDGTSLLSDNKNWGKDLVASASVAKDTSGKINVSTKAEGSSSSCTSSGSCDPVPSFSESQISMTVTTTNDTLTIDGCAYGMGQNQCETLINNNLLFENNLLIDKYKPNGVYKSSATINYVPDQSEGYSHSETSINFVPQANDVIVHTPVVNYDSAVTVRSIFDQTGITSGVPPVVVGKDFTLNLGTTGQHNNHKNYGSRDYESYYGQKRVRFPFDVFWNGTHQPKDTWIDMPIPASSQTFTVAEWVDEGTYTAESQSWAINDQTSRGGSCERNANLNLSNYCSSNTFQIKVIGRISDFRVFDVSDFRYEEVFRKAVGSSEHTGVYFHPGPNDKNGNYAGRAHLLPIMPGSISDQPALAAHSGYSFKFDFKTFGGYYGGQDGVVIEPTFKFVPKSGGTPQLVDLYYNTSDGTNQLIRVGSPEDKFERRVRLMEPKNNVEYSDYSTENFECTYFESGCNWRNDWEKQISKTGARETIISSDFTNLYFNYTNRRLEGKSEFKNAPSSADQADIAKGMQHWYGEFSVPISPKILPRGTDINSVATANGGRLTGHESEFLRDGYIIVNFDIWTYRNNNYNTPVLRYNSASSNTWDVEGQSLVRNGNGATFQLSYGDVIFYDADFSAANDYQP